MSKTLIVATVVGTYLEAIMGIEKENYEENPGAAVASACLAGTVSLPITLLVVHTLPTKFQWIVPVALYCTAAYHASRFKSVE
jgi:H+/Cl- antiporter ClcA